MRKWENRKQVVEILRQIRYSDKFKCKYRKELNGVWKKKNGNI